MSKIDEVLELGLMVQVGALADSDTKLLDGEEIAGSCRYGKLVIVLEPRFGKQQEISVPEGARFSSDGEEDLTILSATGEVLVWTNNMGLTWDIEIDPESRGYEYVTFLHR